MDSLNITELDIIIKSEEQLKQDLISRIDRAAYQYLIEKSQNHSKTPTELYKDLKGSKYLFDSRFSPNLAKLIFSFWTRTYGVKNNFRNKYQENLNCVLCEEEICQQSHLYKCSVIRRVVGQIKGDYEDLFSDDLDKLLEAAKTVKILVETRQILLDP